MILIVHVTTLDLWGPFLIDSLTNHHQPAFQGSMTPFSPFLGSWLDIPFCSVSSRNFLSKCKLGNIFLPCVLFSWVWWVDFWLVEQTIQYMARNKVMQTETRELSSISRGKVRPGDVADWNNESLYVPPLPPTNLRGCHLMRIQYDVFVSTLYLVTN